MGPGLTMLLAFAGGAVVANLYYAQPLLTQISAALGISPAAAGFAMTVMQIGYGVGLLLVVPLGDRFENRRLIVTAFAILAAGLLAAGLAANAAMFLTAALVIGISASVAQIIVPFASHLVRADSGGRALGTVMAGLLLGMMVARPLSSIVADSFGWRAIFLLSAAMIAALAVALLRLVPMRRPPEGFRYRDLLPSLKKLFLSYPLLRRRALIQFFLFSAFTVFWTVVPMLLAGPAYGYTQRGIALFALIGVTGAAAAPFVGWAADRGFGRATALGALLLAILSFLFCFYAETGTTAALLLLVFAGVLLDCGVATSLTLSQRAILALGTAARSRLNGLFFAIFYSGGAVGSAVGAWAYVVGGWTLSCIIGAAMCGAALLLHLTGTAKPEGH